MCVYTRLLGIERDEQIDRRRTALAPLPSSTQGGKEIEGKKE